MPNVHCQFPRPYRAHRSLTAIFTFVLRFQSKLWPIFFLSLYDKPHSLLNSYLSPLEPRQLIEYSDCATGWTTGVRFPTGTDFSSMPPRPDRLWGPLNGHWRLLSRGESFRGMKLNTHLHLALRLRMRGAILSRVFMTWYLVRIGDNFAFTYGHIDFLFPTTFSFATEGRRSSGDCDSSTLRDIVVRGCRNLAFTQDPVV